MELKLPPSVISKTDLFRLAREAAALHEFFLQSRVRGGGKPVAMPKVSRSLEDFSKYNNVNFLNADQRSDIVHKLERLKATAPIVHISFAAEPPAAVLLRIISWFRESTHPQVVLQVGLQPTIAAGCLVRTSNKAFDFSLRSQILSKRDVLASMLRGQQ